MRPRRPSIALAALLPLALLVGACGGDDDDSGAATGGSSQGGSGGGSGSGGGLETVAGALAMMPAGESGGSGESGDPQMVTWGDVERAAALAEVEVPADHTDADAVTDYIQTLTNGRSDADTPSPVLVLPPEQAGAQRIPQIEEFTAEVGWNLLDVARFVERSTAPDVVTVMEGTFDEGAISEALGDPVSDGLWVAGDPEAGDFASDLDDVTVARPLGQTLWMGLDGDRLSVARRQASAEAAAGGGDATLADDEGFAALAGGLDGAEVYGAVLVSPGPTAGDQLSREQADGACDDALPEPTAGVATGIADDGGPVYILTLAHDSPDAAEANAAAVEEIVAEGASMASREPWSEMVTLDGVDITGDGRVVVARLRPTETGPLALWYELVMQADGLVSHC